jgi:BirA family transcriptional regulator, biotin operon repressor / biotin---[acetyl-CoA-carboxylase] ligase
MAGDRVGRSVYLDCRHIALQETVSTNTECLVRARDGDPGNLWITAERQSGGRARRGRSWVSEPGNLYASLLLMDVAPMAQMATLPLAVSLAVHRAVCDVLPDGGQKAKVKWPNDVLIDGRKTSGILLEGEVLKNGRHAVVIGCGINIAHRPDNPLYPSTSLSLEGASVFPDELFSRLFIAMADVLALWDQGRGVKAIVDAWRDVAIGIGDKVTVNLTDRSLSGIFAGIDDNGLLMLDTEANGILSIAAGDVFFG